MSADKLAENTPNAPKFICPSFLLKPKSLEFWWKKATLGVRSPWANPKISNTFSPIFPNSLYLLSTKPMAKWSRAPGQFLGGQWVEQKADFWLFFFQIFKVLQIFRHFILFFKFSRNLGECGIHSYQFNNIQRASSPKKFTYFSPPSHCVRCFYIVRGS